MFYLLYRGERTRGLKDAVHYVETFPERVFIRKQRWLLVSYFDDQQKENRDTRRRPRRSEGIKILIFADNTASCILRPRTRSETCS